MFDYILFVQEILLENKPFYVRNAKMAEKGELYDVIFLNWFRGYLDQNEDYQKSSHVYLHKENKEVQ